jgi:hypothetical protein
VRTKPESTVEWAAEHTVGTVTIKPSAGDTRVTLSVHLEMLERTAASGEAATSTLEPEPVLEHEPAPLVTGGTALA